MKLTDVKLCTFYKQEKPIEHFFSLIALMFKKYGVKDKTIEHLFVDCPYVKEIWCAVNSLKC